MKTRSAQMVIDRTVAMIIAVLVIVIVASIFISLNPNFLYKLIPDLGAPSQTGDEVISGEDLVTASCKNGGEIVGFIGKEGVIFMGNKLDRKTDLIYTLNNKADATINIKDSVWFTWPWSIKWGDSVFGTITNGVVAINSEFLNDSGEFFLKNAESSKPLLVSVSDLILLNGSSYEDGLFCNLKVKQEKEQEQDIIALAQMMWGEEGSQGVEAMKAAGYVAINRWNYVQSRADFGVSKGASLYQVISAHNQFYGYNPLNDYSKTLDIAKEILKNKVSPDYLGYYFFGNNIPSKNTYIDVKMVACKLKNPNFEWKQVGSTTLYLSNGDYTSSDCKISVG